LTSYQEESMFSSRYLALTALALLACGEKQPPADQTTRDLSMAPAESVAALNDQPAQGQQPAAQPAAQPAPNRAPPAAPKPAQAAPTRQPTAPATPTSTTRTVGQGATVMLAAVDTITSRHNKKGETVVATATADIRDARGNVVIPAGAVFTGTISDIAPAESSTSKGRMVLTFNQVEFGGHTYAVAARTDSLATVMKGRGVTTGDAAKVGVGAAAGAVVGGVVGGNKTGAIVGGVVGAAAGTAVAASTKDVDIVLPAGATIRLVLTAPFSVTGK
jgi:hypothetical protein